MKALIPQLKSERVRSILLFTHLGLKDDLKIADANLPIQLIHGAHSHSLTNPSETRNGCTIVHGGCYAQWIPVSTFTIQSGGKLSGLNTSLYPVDPTLLSPSPIIEKLVKPALTEAERAAEEKVGEVKGPLWWNYLGTSPCAEVLADSILSKATQEWPGIHGAITTNSGIRPPSHSNRLIPHWARRTISALDVFDVFPWEDRIVKIRLPGSSIKRFLAASLGQVAPTLIPSGGLRYQYNRPLQNILFASMAGKRIHSAAKYTLAASTFALSLAGDLVGPERQGWEIEENGGTLVRDMFGNYLSAHSPIHRNDPDGRVIDTSGNSEKIEVFP